MENESRPIFKTAFISLQSKMAKYIKYITFIIFIENNAKIKMHTALTAVTILLFISK